MTLEVNSTNTKDFIDGFHEVTGGDVYSKIAKVSSFGEK